MTLRNLKKDGSGESVPDDGLKWERAMFYAAA